MNPEVDRIDELIAGLFPKCSCPWCTAARKDALTADLEKMYGTAAEVRERLQRMD